MVKQLLLPGSLCVKEYQDPNPKALGGANPASGSLAVRNSKAPGLLAKGRVIGSSQEMAAMGTAGVWLRLRGVSRDARIPGEECGEKEMAVWHRGEVPGFSISR